MPTDDANRKKVIYPFLRREPQSENATVVSETIVRESEIVFTSSPLIVISASTARQTMMCLNLANDIVIMNAVSGSAAPSLP